jgi:hypothetical protein
MRSKEHRAKSGLNNAMFDNTKYFEDVITLRGFRDSVDSVVEFSDAAVKSAGSTAVVDLSRRIGRGKILGGGQQKREFIARVPSQLQGSNLSPNLGVKE